MSMADLEVQYRQDELGAIPLRFRGGEADAFQEVDEVVDRWFGSDHCYVRLRTRDGASFILRFDEREARWRIAVFERGAPG